MVVVGQVMKSTSLSCEYDPHGVLMLHVCPRCFSTPHPAIIHFNDLGHLGPYLDLRLGLIVVKRGRLRRIEIRNTAHARYSEPCSHEDRNTGLTIRPLLILTNNPSYACTAHRERAKTTGIAGHDGS